jgi:hypothetical protein
MSIPVAWKEESIKSIKSNQKRRTHDPELLAANNEEPAKLNRYVALRAV